jgi:hypothetical protein
VANSTLWYADNTGDTKDTVPAAQKIVFNNDDIVLENPIQWNYSNSIKQIQNPTNNGDRIMNVTENGLRGFTIPIKGFIKDNQVADRDKLTDFLFVLQIVGGLPFGRFGLDVPNQPRLSVRPTTERGLSLADPIVIKYNAIAKQTDFEYNMFFGGKAIAGGMG